VETFKSEKKFPHVQLALCEHTGDDRGYDMEFVGKCMCDVSDLISGDLALSLHSMTQSRGDIQSMVDALTGCKLYSFGCPGTDLHGHVGLLAPLITANLKELWLNNCKLTDDDVSDLTGIIPKDHGLQRLDIHHNKFTVNGISDITGHLTREHFPKLIRFDVYGMGLVAAEVKEVVERNLPHLKEIEMGIFQLK
jgi:hypothetical protein